MVAFIANMRHLNSMPNRQSASKSLSSASGPSASEADRDSAARLSALLLRQAGGRVRFTLSSDTGESVDLSPSLLNVLETAAEMVASGAGVAVLARNEKLTSQQAADLLNVSRQYMVRLLERGDIASTKVGTHRRVRVEDLTIYRQRRDECRSIALGELADQAQASGGYDTPVGFGPRRRD
jgi:excisionase family DNA binding protein